jgi:16S rRNA (uracil1498-N3)-methyltransferase
MEEDAALRCGYVPVSLGRRVLRAETAALAALAVLLVH